MNMSSPTRKRVLMVAYHYPPEHSSSGVLRTLKFSKYLPEHGWDPVILTVRENFYELTDPALAAQIPPGVEVCRTRAIDTKKTLSIRGKYLRICAIPDRYVGWLPFAVRAGLKFVRSHRIQALYSTSPLASAHLVASVLKSLTDLPWVADFRDPWTEPALARKPGAPLFRLECLLERHVLRHADRLVFTTAQLRDEMISRHKGVPESKTVVIPNGYDEEDFLALPETTPDPLPIRITHTGLVDGSYRSPRGFLEALGKLVQSGEIAPSEVRVDFLGGGDYLRSTDFRSLIGRLRLESIVNIVDHLSYAECLKWQSRSHVLLLLQCGRDTLTLIPAKAFEYLRIGRPVLAVVPPSATAELFERVGGARLVHPEDPAGMQAALRELFAAARAENWKSAVNRLALQSYARRELTARLAQTLDQLGGAN